MHSWNKTITVGLRLSSQELNASAFQMSNKTGKEPHTTVSVNTRGYNSCRAGLI